jgi:hypothetical protein
VDERAQLYLLQHVSTDLHDLYQAVLQVRKKKRVPGIALFLKYVRTMGRESALRRPSESKTREHSC